MKLKQLYLYFTGRVQFAPAWFYRLPEFFIPVYDGKKQAFIWLGKEYPTNEDTPLGITLFGWLRMKREKNQ